LSDEDYRKFYTSDLYRKLYENSENISETLQERYHDNDNEIFSILSPMMEKFDSKTVMEFGCGGGWNLLPFHKADYTVVGYDYSPILTELGKEYGLNLHQGSFSALEDSSILYDVIILNHVIEHFTNFNKNMNQILQYLKPDGLLFIGVPNIDNFNKGQFQNAHTYYFTPRTLKKCLESHNLYLLDSGPASKGFHMYSVYKKVSSKNQGFSSIETNEYNLMMRKYIYCQFRSSMVKTFSVLGLKKIIKSILGLNNNNL